MNSTNSEKKHSLSYIEPHEEIEARELIVKQLGFEPIRPCGYNILIMLYLRPERIRPLTDENGNPILDEDGQQVSLILPDELAQVDKWVSCVGLVLALGPDAYKDPQRYGRSGPWCKVGDWVMIPRNAGHQFNDHGPHLQMRGIPMQIVPEDCILNVIDEPARIKRDGQS